MSLEVSEQDVRRWATELEQIGETIAARFGRPEVRRRAPQSLRGLMAQVERKNGWQLAEFLGEETPKNPAALHCSFPLECQRSP